VLTERLAVFILGHEPGWRLPQRTMLARRFQATAVEIDCAVRQLEDRHLLRQTPDGRIYRVSPAEYVISVEGLPGPGTHIDPMGATVSCTSRHVAWKRLPENVALMLGLQPTAAASTIRCLWSANGRRAALTTTYLPAKLDLQEEADEPHLASLEFALEHIPAVAAASVQNRASGLVAAAMHIEVQAPAKSVAGLLELRPGSPAITVAVCFRDPASRTPAALTVAVLRSDLFRVVIDSTATGLPQLDGSLASGWALAE
jgi:DNA-binding GntR family transcriptional regulator